VSTVHLIIGPREDAARMARAALREWSNLAIDPIDNVSLARLFVLLTGTNYDTVAGSFTRETPAQPDVESWDFENLIFPVYSIPEQYVRALANVRDEDLATLANEWSKIEEFKWYGFDPDDLKDQVASFREFAAKCIKEKQSLLIYLAP
jgi:hypothetical protein